jgi:hypothetical protein
LTGTGCPAPNPKRKPITGVVCGVRVEKIKDPLMRKLRTLDKLVDELAQGRAMEKILREQGMERVPYPRGLQSAPCLPTTFPPRPLNLRCPLIPR